MSTSGLVREWHAEDGWGVIDSPETPGGCWAGFGVVLVEGYRSLTPGQAVEFSFTSAEQDGYAYRALEVWPAGLSPVHFDDDAGPSAAYFSTLTITFDERAARD
jgi:cold shock protein